MSCQDLFGPCAKVGPQASIYETRKLFVIKRRNVLGCACSCEFVSTTQGLDNWRPYLYIYFSVLMSFL